MFAKNLLDCPAPNDSPVGLVDLITVMVPSDVRGDTSTKLKLSTPL